MHPHFNQKPTDGLVVYLPVYETALSDQTPARRREALIGYVVAALQLGKFIRGAPGASEKTDVAIVGDEATVCAQIRALEDCGVTDFAAAEFAQSADEVRRTRDALRSLL